jgi:hypothetical protein
MPYAKADVEKAIELWKLALTTTHGLAIAVNIDRRYFLNILQEARRVYVSTEESYHYVTIIPEEPDDEVWIVRRYENDEQS